MKNIIESNYFSFDEYKRLVEKYKQDDWREINFQNRVVLILLEKLFINDDSIAIVDVSAQYKNRESSLHTRTYYANNHTPDLLVVKNWNYHNQNKTPSDYLAVIEVKSPILDPISNDNNHTTEEIQDYIKNGNKVILTDCQKWVFYGFESEPKSFTLFNENRWEMIEQDNPDFLIKEFGIEERRLVSKEWDNLIAYIQEHLV